MSEPIQFEKHDIVRLASGSVDMNVIGYDHSGMIECWWVQADVDTESGFFDPATLVYAE
jgi:uncharacterized protein YodC (DUF2158 family)